MHSKEVNDWKAWYSEVKSHRYLVQTKALPSQSDLLNKSCGVWLSTFVLVASIPRTYDSLYSYSGSFSRVSICLSVLKKLPEIPLDAVDSN
jgi:hypothetical protein